jgi:hypothetical protein
MRAKAIGSKALAHVKTDRATGDQVQNAAGHNAAQNLRHDVGQKLVGRETTTGPQTDGHRRIQVTTQDVANGKGPCQAQVSLLTARRK